MLFCSSYIQGVQLNQEKIQVCSWLVIFYINNAPLSELT